MTLSLSSAKAALVNGVFGDPLLHIRLRHLKRSLLFDLGDSARLPARIVHQVSDVFISHAHFDHIGGFLWFLRSCLGSPVLRHLFGPPGLVGHIRGMLGGIHWDRIGERGPVFELTEVGESDTVSYRLKLALMSSSLWGRIRCATAFSWMKRPSVCGWRPSITESRFSPLPSRRRVCFE